MNDFANSYNSQTMNNIVIRAKDVTGQWVTGDLVHNKRVTATGLAPRTMVGGCEVDPNTVALFSGVCDIKGVKIFEGDILKVECTDGSSIYKLVRFVPEKAAFCMANTIELNAEGKWDIWSYMSQRWINEMEAIVIGNIYDNPDLL